MGGMQVESVQRFIDHCQGKQKTELLQLVNNARKDEELLLNLIKCIENVCDEGEHSNDLNSLCNVLFDVYQTGYSQCHLFVLQFIPSLLSVYCMMDNKSTKMSLGRLEAVILAVYNKEVLSQQETPFAKSFRIPSLSKTSVYHEPFNWSTSLLTENALTRHELSDKPVLLQGPNEVLSRIPAGYRLQVFSTVLQEYNSKISVMCESSHIALCKLSMRITLSGYCTSGVSSTTGDNLIDFDGIARLECQPRLRLNSSVIKGLLQGLYFLMYNGLANYAKQALDCVHNYCQSSLHVPGCMVSLGMVNMMELASRNRGRDTPGFVTDPFLSKRRSADQSLPKSRTCTRPSTNFSVKDTKDFIVVDGPSTVLKRDELQVFRPMTRAVSDSDIASRPTLMNGEKAQNSGNPVSSLDSDKTDTEVDNKSNGKWNANLVLQKPLYSSTDVDRGKDIELTVPLLSPNATDHETRDQGDMNNSFNGKSNTVTTPKIDINEETIDTRI